MYVIWRFLFIGEYSYREDDDMKWMYENWLDGLGLDFKLGEGRVKR